MKKITYAITNILLAFAFVGCSASLHTSAENGDLEKVKSEISKGIDVDYRDADGKTALIYASTANKTKVMEYLLEHGADINATTQFNETALFWATAFGHVDAVRLLLNKNADTQIINNDHKTALDLSRDLNKEEIERMLIAEITSKLAQFKVGMTMSEVMLLPFLNTSSFRFTFIASPDKEERWKLGDYILIFKNEKLSSWQIK